MKEDPGKKEQNYKEPGTGKRPEKVRQQMAEAVAYLDSTPLFAKKSSMENIKKYLGCFGHPEHGIKIIHVAGTNGKGSVCSYIASCLREAGFRVGLFTSPHLCDIRERFRIDGEMISEEEFLSLFEKVKKECLKEEEGRSHLLYFEFLFVMAMLWYSEKKPDYLVLETGLGGRLDATNTIDEKAVAVITRIGIDHTVYLGNTLSAIAGEKAGILRKGCPAVFLSEPEDAFRVISERALKIGAPAYTVSPDMWRINRADENGIDFSLDNRYDKNLRIKIPDRALYQCENASLAATAAGIVLREAGNYDPRFLERGMEKSIWPGRMEEILPGVWIDGAHNPDGIRAFLESAAKICGKMDEDEKEGRRFLLFSCVRDKDYSDELHQIGSSGLFTDIAAVPMEGKRALEEEVLLQQVSASSSGIRIHRAASVKDAVDRFILHKEKNDRVFAAGSLYLVGEIRSLLSGAAQAMKENR